MSVLKEREVTEIANLTDEQCDALNKASAKKKFRVWNQSLFSMYVLVTFFLLLTTVFFAAIWEATAAADFGIMTVFVAIAGAIQYYTYMLALKAYDVEEIKYAVLGDSFAPLNK